MNKEVLEYSILIAATLLIVFSLSFITRRILNFFIKRNSKELKVDPTNFIFLKNSISFILYTIGFFWIFYKIPYFNSLGAALFAGAGIFAAIIGFSSQKAISNIVGGVFILIFKPFRVGDTIEISNNRKGTIEEITLRHTVIKDYENRRVIIPNSQISDETLINSSISDEKVKKHIEINIAYDSDINKAMEIIRAEIMKHPLNIDNRDAQEKEDNLPSVDVKLISLKDFSVTLKAYAWAKNNDDAFDLHCDVLKSIKGRFDENGIEIPHPYRTIVFKNDMINRKKETKSRKIVQLSKENSEGLSAESLNGLINHVLDNRHNYSNQFPNEFQD
ncbi:MAG: small conductance mechanosensitive channel [Parvicellaceae bacterium]|jgi:small conductance mechanosensitive channel